MATDPTPTTTHTRDRLSKSSIKRRPPRRFSSNILKKRIKLKQSRTKAGTTVLRQFLRHHVPPTLHFRGAGTDSESRVDRFSQLLALQADAAFVQTIGHFASPQHVSLYDFIQIFWRSNSYEAVRARLKQGVMDEYQRMLRLVPFVQETLPEELIVLISEMVFDVQLCLEWDLDNDDSDDLFRPVVSASPDDFDLLDTWQSLSLAANGDAIEQTVLSRNARNVSYFSDSYYCAVTGIRVVDNFVSIHFRTFSDGSNGAIQSPFHSILFFSHLQLSDEEQASMLRARQRMPNATPASFELRFIEYETNRPNHLIEGWMVFEFLNFSLVRIIEDIAREQREFGTLDEKTFRFTSRWRYLYFQYGYSGYNSVPMENFLVDAML